MNIITGERVLVTVRADGRVLDGLEPMSCDVDWSKQRAQIRLNLRRAPDIEQLTNALDVQVTIKLVDLDGNMANLTWQAKLLALDVPGRRDAATLTLEAIG